MHARKFGDTRTHCTIGGAVLGGAAGTPNILNVAVSRAKQYLYVVGSFAAWSGISTYAESAWRPRSMLTHTTRTP